MKPRTGCAPLATRPNSSPRRAGDPRGKSGTRPVRDSTLGLPSPQSQAWQYCVYRRSDKHVQGAERAVGRVVIPQKRFGPFNWRTDQVFNWRVTVCQVSGPVCVIRFPCRVLGEVACDGLPSRAPLGRLWFTACEHKRGPTRQRGKGMLPLLAQCTTVRPATVLDPRWAAAAAPE